MAARETARQHDRLGFQTEHRAFVCAVAATICGRPPIAPHPLSSAKAHTRATMMFIAAALLTRRRDLLTGVIGMATVCGACAAPAAEASALAEAKIITPSGVAAAEPSIRFGAFAATAEGQAVTVHPGGGRTMHGVLPAGVDRFRDFGPADLIVTGELGWMYSIALPSSAVVTSSSGPSSLESLRITDFRIAPAGDDRRLPGLQRLFLGATVVLGSGNLQGGHYKGSVTVTVSYE